MKARTLYVVEVTLAVAAALVLILLAGHWADLPTGMPALWPPQGLLPEGATR